MHGKGGTAGDEGSKRLRAGYATASSCLPRSTHTAPHHALTLAPSHAPPHRSELVPAFKETLTDAEEKLGADIVMK